MVDSADDVSKPNEEYEVMRVHWHLTASLRGGTPAMRVASREYLPQEPAESEEAYKNRVQRSVLTNYYKKTVEKLVGKPLKKPIVVGDDVPNKIKDLLDDVDLLGNGLDVFAKQLLTAGLDDGIVHILVDQQSTKDVMGEMPNGNLSIRQERDLNIRPFARLINAASLIGWRIDVINGQKELTQVRILELKKRPKGKFGQETVKHIRVIQPGLYEVYEEVQEDGGETEWILVEAGTNTMDKISLVTLYTNQKGFMLAEPALLDLAHLNVAHWQSDSDQRNLLHIARVPILFATGFGDDDDQVQLQIGANSMTRAPQGATLEYVEHTGAGLESGIKDLDALEQRIQMLGVQMNIKRAPGDVTATARLVDKDESDSPMALLASELEKALENMLVWFAKWLGILNDSETAGSLTVFKDFGLKFADLKDAEILLDARKNGDISQMTLLDELKKRGLLDDDFDPQTEIDLLDLESGNRPFEDADSASDAPNQGLSDEEVERRNRVGDSTSFSDGHRHTLQEGGVTDTVVDDEGNSHNHTWDELGIRTSSEDGHDHILLVRAADNPPMQIGVTNDELSSEGDEEEGSTPAGSSEE